MRLQTDYEEMDALTEAVKKEDMKYLNSFFDLTVRLVDDEGLVRKLLGSENLAQFKDRLPIL